MYCRHPRRVIKLYIKFPHQCLHIGNSPGRAKNNNRIGTVIRHDLIATVATRPCRALFGLSTTLEDLRDFFRDAFGLGKPNRYNRYLRLLPLDVEQFENIKDPPHFITGITDDEGVGRLIGNHGVRGDNPRQGRLDLFCIDIFERNNLGDNFVSHHRPARA